ncbi:hypothetical protein WG947_15980 [Pontibacter sp. H259]|uniref:hypothetical protein n=1 Tax=Pontibacter sp. H259 TaxID=3133421 RepID=UPI0030C2CC5D
MKKIACLLLLLALAGTTTLQAQDTYVPYDPEIYRLIDRYQILYGNQPIANEQRGLHPAVRPFGRKDVAALAEISARNAQTSVDQFNTEYLLNDNWNYTDQESNNSARPLFNTFYTNRTDLFHYEGRDFVVRVNPVLHVEVGHDNQSDGIRYTNTRGVQVEGVIDDRLSFYTIIAETQAKFPEYVVRRFEQENVVPHEGWWKRFKGDGFDFLNARGYLNYNLTKHVEIQLGHDRHFIGNGYRSLLLSDYAPPSFFLKLNTQVWRIHYMNLFQELTAKYRRLSQDVLFDKKYMAFHRLGVQITDNFDLGISETVIFGRRKGRFELQYLNPIIFYRSIEQAIGSEDNVTLAADFRWNIWNRVQLYGQLMLDEFLLNEVKAGNGWWANKQAGQVGAKYINAFGLDNLDLQGEVNIIRPYTYQHLDNFRNFQHFNQPLAHPIGANLYEAIGVVRYQPIPRLNLTGKAIYTKYGQDEYSATDTINWGGNVNLPYTLRPTDYGHKIAQGNTTNQLHLDLNASFQLRHNVFVDVKQILRRSDAEINSFDLNTSFTSFAFRWNIPQRLHEF